MSDVKHPMQPLVRDEQGVVRFKKNKIVEYLLDREPDKFNLNHLAHLPFDQDDWVQFYQLIGYSLSGFHELSRVPDSACEAASRVAREQLSDPKIGGCRDDGCPIHCEGVDE